MKHMRDERAFLRMAEMKVVDGNIPRGQNLA